jgi:hypothetical protein
MRLSRFWFAQAITSLKPLGNPTINKMQNQHDGGALAGS